MLHFLLGAVCLLAAQSLHESETKKLSWKCEDNVAALELLTNGVMKQCNTTVCGNDTAFRQEFSQPEGMYAYDLCPEMCEKCGDDENVDYEIDQNYFDTFYQQAARPNSQPKSLRIKGYMPKYMPNDPDSDAPLYVWLSGAGDAFFGAADRQMMKSMAKRGYVAAQVEYDFPSSSEDPARLMCQSMQECENFQVHDIQAAIRVLCNRKGVCCAKGVAVHGYAEGSLIAWLLPIVDHSVTAILAFGLGMYRSLGSTNASTCFQSGYIFESPCHFDVSKDTHFLNVSKRRAINGPSTTLYPEQQKQLNLMFGYNESTCADPSLNCLQDDQSGWYILSPTEQVWKAACDHDEANDRFWACVQIGEKTTMMGDPINDLFVDEGNENESSMGVNLAWLASAASQEVQATPTSCGHKVFLYAASITVTQNNEVFSGPPSPLTVAKALLMWRRQVGLKAETLKDGTTFSMEPAVIWPYTSTRPPYAAAGIADDQGDVEMVRSIFKQFIRSHPSIDVFFCPTDPLLVKAAVEAVNESNAPGRDAPWICWATEAWLYYEPPLNNDFTGGMLKSVLAVMAARIALDDGFAKLQNWPGSGKDGAKITWNIPDWYKEGQENAIPTPTQTNAPTPTPTQSPTSVRRLLDDENYASESFADVPLSTSLPFTGWLPSTLWNKQRQIHDRHRIGGHRTYYGDHVAGKPELEHNIFDINLPSDQRWNHALALVRRKGGEEIVIIHDSEYKQEAETVIQRCVSLNFSKIWLIDVVESDMQARAFWVMPHLQGKDAIVLMTGIDNSMFVILCMRAFRVSTNALIMEYSQGVYSEALEGFVLNQILVPTSFFPRVRAIHHNPSPLFDDVIAFTDLYYQLEEGRRFDWKEEFKFLLPQFPNNSRSGARWTKELLRPFERTAPLAALEIAAAGELYYSAVLEADNTSYSAIISALRGGTHKTMMGDIAFNASGVRQPLGPNFTESFTRQYRPIEDADLSVNFLDSSPLLVDLHEHRGQSSVDGGGIQEILYPMLDFATKEVDMYPCQPGCHFTKLTCEECPPGRYRDTDDYICKGCQPGRFSNVSGVSACEKCPRAGADCSSRLVPTPLEDWYYLPVREEIELLSTVNEQSCPEPKRERVFHWVFECLSKDGMCRKDGTCGGDNIGMLCAVCPPKYSSQNVFAGNPGRRICFPCQSNMVSFSMLLAVMALWAGVCIVLSRAAKDASMNPSSLRCATLRTFISNAQMMLCVFESTTLDSRWAPAVFVAPFNVVYRPFNIIWWDCGVKAFADRLMGRDHESGYIREKVLASAAIFPCGVLLLVMGHRTWHYFYRLLLVHNVESRFWKWCTYIRRTSAKYGAKIIGKRLFMRKWDRKYWKLAPGVAQEIVLVKKTDQNDRGKLWVVAQPDFSLVTVDVGSDRFGDSPVETWDDDDHGSKKQQEQKKQIEDKEFHRRLDALHTVKEKNDFTKAVEKQRKDKQEEAIMRYVKVPKLRLAMRMRLEGAAESLVEEGLVRACLLEQPDADYAASAKKEGAKFTAKEQKKTAMQDFIDAGRPHKEEEDLTSDSDIVEDSDHEMEDHDAEEDEEESASEEEEPAPPPKEDMKKEPHESDNVEGDVEDQHELATGAAKMRASVAKLSENAADSLSHFAGIAVIGKTGAKDENNEDIPHVLITFPNVEKKDIDEAKVKKLIRSKLKEKGLKKAWREELKYIFHEDKREGPALSPRENVGGSRMSVGSQESTTQPTAENAGQTTTDTCIEIQCLKESRYKVKQILKDFPIHAHHKHDHLKPVVSQIRDDAQDKHLAVDVSEDKEEYKVDQGVGQLYNALHIKFRLSIENRNVKRLCLCFLLVSFAPILRGLSEGFMCADLVGELDERSKYDIVQTSVFLRVHSAFNVTCYDDEMRPTRKLAKALYGAYAVACPLAVLGLLRICREDWSVPDVRRAYCVLYTGFKPRWYWWEVVHMIRTALVFFINANIADRSQRFTLVFGTLMVFATIQVTVRPYAVLDRFFLTKLDLFGICGCLSVLTASTVVFKPAEQPGHEILFPQITNEQFIQFAIGLSVFVNALVVAYGLFKLLFAELVMESLIAKSTGCILGKKTARFVALAKKFWSLDFVYVEKEEQTALHTSPKVYIDSQYLNSHQYFFLEHSMEGLLHNCVLSGSKFYPAMLSVALQEGFERAVETRKAYMRDRYERFGYGTQPIQKYKVCGIRSLRLGFTLGRLYQFPPDVLPFDFENCGVTVEELGDTFEGVRQDIIANQPFLRYKMQEHSSGFTAKHPMADTQTWGEHEHQSKFMQEMEAGGRADRTPKFCNMYAHEFIPILNPNKRWVCMQFSVKDKHGLSMCKRTETWNEKPGKQHRTNAPFQRAGEYQYDKANPFACTICGLQVCGECKDFFFKEGGGKMSLRMEKASREDPDIRIQKMKKEELEEELEILTAESLRLEELLMKVAAEAIRAEQHELDEDEENYDYR